MSLPSTASRNGRFHLRIRIPEDLRPYFGKVEIHRSLGAGRQHARSMARSLRQKVEDCFGDLRRQRAAGASDDVLAFEARRFYEAGLPATRLRSIRRSGTAASNGPQTLAEAIAAFVVDRQGRWAGKTKQMQESSLALFLRIVGNKSLSGLTRQDCRDARNTIARLPPNLTKRFDAPIDEVLAAGHPPRGPKTTNSNIAAVHSMLEWCRREGLLSDNPARGLLLPVGRRPDLERDAFTPAELQKLFAHLDPSMGARYWLPLVALYSGMRLEEIAQLRPADIREVQGIWVMDVNAAGGKRLKTASSARLVPLHPRLLGILELREGTEMWPGLTRGADGYWSSPFSKWFGRFKRRAGIASRRLTFHSLRHTFINELKQRGTDELTIRELVGHANPSITTGRYGKRLEPHRLAAAINPLDFGVATTNNP